MGRTTQDDQEVKKMQHELRLDSNDDEEENDLCLYKTKKQTTTSDILKERVS